MKIKYLLLSLLVPLLVSFCSADTVDGYTSDSAISTYSYIGDMVDFRDIPGFSSVCSNGCYMCITSTPVPYFTNNGLFISNGSSDYTISDNNYCFNGKSSSLSDQGIFIANAEVSAYQNATIYFSSSPISISLDYESMYNSLLQSYNTLSGQLSSCQSSLSDCQSNGSHCDTLYGTCVENLSGCNADKISLQNYNDSLSNQLNQCLESSVSGENASGLYLNYNMFWQDNDSMFSLPITNNLFLPNGYKGKLDDDNVLSIAKLNNLEAAYMFSDDDKVNIIDLLSMVMLFLLATGSLIGLIVFLKRLVIKK